MVGILGLVCGCSGLPAPPAAPSPSPTPQPEPAATTPPQPEPAAPASASTAEPEAVETSPPDPAVEPEPTGPTVAEVCEELCVSADQRCTKKSAYRCRALCKTYVKKAAGCEEETKKALTCQAGGDDAEVCSHVAAVKCSRDFQRMLACQRGEKPAVKAPKGPPDHWQSIRDEELTISVAMPPGAQLDPNAKRRTWRAEEGGITYVVTELPPPRRKISDGSLLRMVVNHVGYRCQRNLKVHGRFTSHGVTGVAYSTSCTDGTQRAGMLRIRNDRAVSVGVEAPGGVQLDLNPFLFSFEYLDRLPDEPEPP